MVLINKKRIDRRKLKREIKQREPNKKIKI
jgi:hypothetical protein